MKRSKTFIEKKIDVSPGGRKKTSTIEAKKPRDKSEPTNKQKVDLGEDSFGESEDLFVSEKQEMGLAQPEVELYQESGTDIDFNKKSKTQKMNTRGRQKMRGIRGNQSNVKVFQNMFYDFSAQDLGSQRTLSNNNF